MATPDPESLISTKDIILGLGAMVLGLFQWGALGKVKEIEKNHDALADDHDDTAAAMIELRTTLPEKYISKNDFNTSLDNVFKVLRRIEDKLDGKADK